MQKATNIILQKCHHRQVSPMSVVGIFDYKRQTGFYSGFLSHLRFKVAMLFQIDLLMLSCGVKSIQKVISWEFWAL